MVNYSALNSTANFISNSELALVRYAYVTIGAIMLVASVLHAVAYRLDHHLKYVHNQQMASTQQTTRKENNPKNSNNKLAKRQSRKK